MNGNGKINNFKDLRIWEEGMAVSQEVYELTAAFPKAELFGLVSQMRRSSVSIPSNIAEGFMRFHKKEFKQFLFIALGSSAELETQILLSVRLGLCCQKQAENILEMILRLNKMVMSLVKRC